MITRTKHYLIPILLILFCISDIETIISGMKKALNVCASSIVPSLFLFMILSEITVSLLLKNNSVSHPKIIIFFLGALCGFPIGAAVCEKLYTNGIIDKKSAKALMPFCNIASPAFVIGAIGVSMLKSKELGIVIYTSQVLSSLMPILFIKCKGAKKEYSPQNNKATEIIFDSIDSSTSKMLKLCALICFFATLLATIENTFLVYLSPILEISCGSSFCANLYNTNPFLSILLCGFCCGFSGICVHFQVIMTAKTININYKEFFIIKFFQGVFSGILSVVLYYFFFYA